MAGRTLACPLVRRFTFRCLRPSSASPSNGHVYLIATPIIGMNLVFGTGEDQTEHL